MTYFILWYLSLTLLGLLTFPLAYRLFPALADRGYSLSRALGLLLWGFVFWLCVSFGILRNETGGLLFALLVMLGLSAWALYLKENGAFDLPAVLGWLKANLRLVLSVEALFLVAFAAWAFVRANNPDTTGTEKPMEIAFINAILRSPSFPPHDPWLSGYGISYYYFGYVLAAMLAMLTATPGGVTFNLMLALVFAMSVIGAYGMLYNLLDAYWGAARRLYSALGAIFAPLFLVLLGNLEGFLELLRAYGIGWGNPTSNFWLWLNMKDLSTPPVEPYTWSPRFWFWWRASRVLHDYDLKGNFIEIIDEFPFFSYLLGDLHPHVLAMPFGLLAGALALNLYLGGWKGETTLFGFLKLPLPRAGLALTAVVLGGLAFLNTWDFPVYLALVCVAFVLWQAHERGWGWELLEDFFKLFIPLALASVLLYLPFYISFSSQAGGILPNVLFPTRGAYVWIMFGTLLVPLGLFLAWLTGARRANWRLGFALAVGGTLILWVFSLLLGLISAQTEAGKAYIAAQGLTSVNEILAEAFSRRLEFGAGLLTLVLLIGGGLAFLTAPQERSSDPESLPAPGPIPFVLALVLFGGLLVLAPEFVYLRDQFSSRMNTVFKFYYQAWALWSLAAAFGFVVLLRELRGVRLALFGLLMGAVLFAGFTYPALALPAKTDNFSAGNPDRRTLDGAAYLKQYNPDDYAAIQWLTYAPAGVVAEAVGGSYSDFGRVSTYSGQPSVLGWPGHESQWRGGYTLLGNRSEDIARLYTTSSWLEAEAILAQYGVRYVMLGQMERNTYVVNEIKFSTNLQEVYRQGQAVVYQVP